MRLKVVQVIFIGKLLKNAKKSSERLKKKETERDGKIRRTALISTRHSGTGREKEVLGIMVRKTSTICTETHQFLVVCSLPFLFGRDVSWRALTFRNEGRKSGTVPPSSQANTRRLTSEAVMFSTPSRTPHCGYIGPRTSRLAITSEEQSCSETPARNPQCCYIGPKN